MEVAGTAIGVISLAALMQSCFDIYAKIVALKGAEEDLEDAKVCLQFEIARVDLVRKKNDMRGLDADTEMFLRPLQSEINKRMARIEALIRKHSSTKQPILSAMMFSKRPESSSSNASPTRRVRRRAKWIATDKEALKDNLSELRYWTTMMWHAVSTQAERTKASYLLGTDIISTRDESRLITLTDMPEALYPGIVKAAKIKQLLLESTRPVGVSRSSTMTLVENSPLSAPKVYTPISYVPITSILWADIDETRSRNKSWTSGLCKHQNNGLQDVPVIVEWRGPFMWNETPESAERRLDRLCDLLRAMHSVDRDLELSKSDEFERNADFGTLECLGWTKKNEAFDSLGLVFRYPHRDTHSPVSLWVKIMETRRAAKIPSLGDRFDLAFGISNAIANVIGVDWRHRAIRSENMLVFNKVHIKKAYLIGFTYARPEDSGKEFSTLPDRPDLALYRPPTRAKYGEILDDDDDDDNEEKLATGAAELLVEAWSAAHDMYSLGIVLLEIGLWNTAAKIIEVKRGKTERENLNDGIAQLSYRCGDIYRNVVEKCLDPTNWGQENVMGNLSSVLGSLKQCRA